MISSSRGLGKLLTVLGGAVLLSCAASCGVPEYSSTSRDGGAGGTTSASGDSASASLPGSNVVDGSPREVGLSEQCSDGQKDGDESDIDCGGSTCLACQSGKACQSRGDCASGVCREAACLAPVCNDSVQNGDETDVDCGGTCPAKCNTRQTCNSTSDCTPGLVCAGVPLVCVAPTCTNQVQDVGETDVDCGGTSCGACPPGALCAIKDDCTSGVCSYALASLGPDGDGGVGVGVASDGAGGVLRCQPQSCSDGVKNGSEIDKDCGGSCAIACRAGQHCSKNSDCRSGVCAEDSSQAVPMHLCLPGVCDNGAKDGTETGVDCGGTCPRCQDGSTCVDHADCLSGSCQLSICVSATCNDGLKNGTESDVDCGGPLCGPCVLGKACRDGSDCASLNCTSTKACGSEACNDGIKNQDESAIDCGGRTCPKCADGAACAGASDCQSGVCTNGACRVPSCSDRVANGTETSVDCGGSCALAPTSQKCAEREPCLVSADCALQDCHGGFCQPVGCTDGMQGDAETDVDCGGTCKRCGTGAHCALAADCVNGICDGGTCKAPTCQDGVKNSAETDVDCGGGTCAPCGAARACSSPLDCQSKLCTSGICQAASCSDQVQNQGESAVDCGGVQTPSCSRCPPGRTCGQDSDCESKVCGSNGRCATGTCTDGLSNQDESDIDCGGSYCNPCDNNRSCTLGRDCRSSSCVNQKCVAATCTDGVKNGTETASDCGGSCATSVPAHACASGMLCGSSVDCASGICASNSCQVAKCQPQGDGIKNGTETDVDCGGAGCPTCPEGKDCSANSDCTSGVCTGRHCAAASCVPADLVRNGTETDVDCGGVSCPACIDGKACSANSDCASGVCETSAKICEAAKCPDSVMNQGETDVDCGGTKCTTRCGVGKRCSVDSDCVTGAVCSGGTCKNPACDDGKWDGTETDVDCGGATCQAAGELCTAGQKCTTAADCAGGTAATCPSGKCVVATCGDGKQDNRETDVDCGGGTCAKCSTGKKCTADTDCASNVCNTTCQGQGCSPGDSRKDGTETDVDCGGTGCPKCRDGKKCSSASDCTSGVCTSGVCQVPKCSPGDGVKNGTETDVDCGGSSCSVKCPDGDTCLVSADCVNAVCSVSAGVGATALANTCPGGSCTGGTCRSTSCSDGLWGGNESDTDCGGPCSKCATGKKCTADTDCASNVCNSSSKICEAQGCSPADGRKDGTETDVDCGGSACPGCPDGRACSQPSDCLNGGRCTGNVCQAPTCGDDLPNHGETDVDCGGTNCSPCVDGKVCSVATDCTSHVCGSSSLTCVAPTCDDRVQNHNETDVDCGGTQSPPCRRCTIGEKCSIAGDCDTGTCTDNLCVASPFKILYHPHSSDTPTDNRVYYQYKIVNASGSAVQYNQLKVRYWFTQDGSAGLTANCYYWLTGSSSDCGSASTGSELIAMNFYALSPSRGGADYYMETTFSGSASLPANSDSGEIQVSFHHNNWTPNFAETAHYSYRSGSSYTEWSHITLYLNGTLVWGTEPP